MTAGTQDTVAKGLDPRIIARTVYLNEVLDLLKRRKTASRERVLAAYAACPVKDERLQDDVQTKVHRMLGNLIAHDERAWATFLSVHVGFTDLAMFATFKDLSPFSTWIVVEQDVVVGRMPVFTVRGECQRYIAAMHADSEKDLRTFAISSHVVRDEAGSPDGKRMERTLIAVRVTGCTS